MRSGRGALVLAISGALLLAGMLCVGSRLSREASLSSFTTDLAGRSEAQRTNIVRALGRLDGTVIPPGAEFSFNAVVGRRVIEDGYERAPAMGVGGVQDTPGGGICQLSSTVYNAALLADLRIVERWPHMRPVRSVGPGRDATVAYGRFDLRFVNPHGSSIRVVGHAEGDRLVVGIRGGAPLGHAVTVRVESVPQGDRRLRVLTWRRSGEREERISDDLYPL